MRETDMQKRGAVLSMSTAWSDLAWTACVQVQGCAGMGQGVGEWRDQRG